MTTSHHPHRWRFSRTGGVDQVLLQGGQDIVRLGDLDQKLWVALAMPTHGVQLDARTLALLDDDGDGRVRAPQVLDAVRFVEENWKDPGDLVRGGERVALAALRDGPVLAAARTLLADIGKPEAAEVALDDVTEAEKRFNELPLNGDGVVPADTVTDPEVRQLVEEVIGALGSTPDRSGKPGVDRARVEAFVAAARATVDWQARVEVPEARAALLPLDDATAAAAAALAAVRAKIDDWYVRSRLAAFDPRAAAFLGGSEADLGALAQKELTLATPELARLPLARIDPGRPLPLRSGLNPAWAAAVAAFVEQTVKPLLGRDPAALAEADWAALQARLAAHLAWAAEKPASPVAALPVPRLRDVLDGDAPARLLALVDADLARAEDRGRIVLVERLVRYQRDLHVLLNNFVSFSEFYSRRRGTFQAGTLYLDGRSCDLTFVVTDAGKHGALAGHSNAFLAYCDCTRPGGEKMTIAAAFTGGGADNLMVGRNGLFYDSKGRDWDATVTRIVSNPISVREAFFAPYKKLSRMIEEQLTKRASAADAESHKLVSASAESIAYADRAAPAGPAAPPAPARRIDVGTVAAIGVALGGIGAMVTGILSAVLGLGLWMPIGVLAILLLISGPSMFLAWLKLRQRNLGPILDASGWAINGRARINVPFGGALTHLAKLPAGADRTFTDPYAERGWPWKRYLALAVVLVLGLAWFLGRIDRYLPIRARSTSVLGQYAPAAAPPGLDAPAAPVAPTTQPKP